MRRKCESCGKPYEAKRPSSKYCGETCRKRAGRARAAGRKLAPVIEISPGPAEPVESEQGSGPGMSPLMAALWVKLEAADLLDTIEGQQALLLASRLSNPFETGSAISSMSKELRAILAEAFRGKGAGDVVDEIRARRDAKRAGAS